MQIKSIVGAAMASVAVACFVGCTVKPVSVVEVDQSILPATAKALLTQDSTIDRVEKETYPDGRENFVVTYTKDGVQKSIKVNAKDHSSPSGVFEKRKV